MYKSTISGCLLLIFTGCTTYVAVQNQTPPEIPLPHVQAHFLFVNRFVPDKLEFNNENKIEVFDKGMRSYIAGLEAGFESSDAFHLHLSDTVFAGHSAHQTAYDLSKDEISYLTTRTPAEYIITLDYYHLYFDQEVEAIENEDGSKSKTAYYDLVLATTTTLYDREGRIRRKVEDEHRMLHNSRSVLSGLLAAGPSMGKADENVVLISRELGEAYVNKFYPSDNMELRTFYSTREFKSAAEAYHNEQWEIVERELMLLTRNPDPKIQGKAAYNLAVLYENMGRYEDMAYWKGIAQEKLGKLPDKHAFINHTIF